jgi:hypothetical protein
MEDPMDENEDDNLDQGWKLEERKTKKKLRRPKGGSVLVQETRGNVNKGEKKKVVHACNHM